MVRMDHAPAHTRPNGGHPVPETSEPGDQVRSWSRAYATAAVREETPTFVKMLET